MVDLLSVVVLLFVVTGVNAMVVVVEYDVWSANWRHGLVIYFESNKEKWMDGVHGV